MAFPDQTETDSNITFMAAKPATARHRKSHCVRRICADFPNDYWRKLDEKREYPTEFVNALTQAGDIGPLQGLSGKGGLPACGETGDSGGGMRHGQVIGSTDRLGGEANERPVQFGEVFATLYHGLGIDVSKVTLPDLTGRPQFLVDQGYQPMRELVG